MREARNAPCRRRLESAFRIRPSLGLARIAPYLTNGLGAEVRRRARATLGGREGLGSVQLCLSRHFQLGDVFNFAIITDFFDRKCLSSPRSATLSATARDPPTHQSRVICGISHPAKHAATSLSMRTCYTRTSSLASTTTLRSHTAPGNSWAIMSCNGTLLGDSGLSKLP